MSLTKKQQDDILRKYVEDSKKKPVLDKEARERFQKKVASSVMRVSDSDERFVASSIPTKEESDEVKYYMLGLNEFVMGRLNGLTYEVFNKQTGKWMESSYAFDQIELEYARQIPKSEVESRIQVLFPDEDVKQWF